MRCAWATLPTCTSRGLCAYQRVNAHVQGFAHKRHSTTDTTAPKTQTTSPTTPRFSAFFAEVVCTLGTTPPQTVISPPPNGGNGVIRTTTRRRHADSQPLMLQPPHRHRRGGYRRDRRARAAAPERSEGRAAGHVGRGTRGRRGLVGQRAEAPIEGRGADGSRAGRPRRSPAPRPGPAPRKPAGPQATTSATRQHVVSYNPVFAQLMC